MPQLSIVVPTFNEVGNVVELRDRVAASIADVDGELIYVDDDSPNGTAAASPIVAVMDADLQHDESKLPAVLRILMDEAEVDVVVGSRYVDSGSVEG